MYQTSPSSPSKKTFHVLPGIPEASEGLENTEDSTILEELSTTEEPVTPEESNKLKEHIKTPKNLSWHSPGEAESFCKAQN